MSNSWTGGGGMMSENYNDMGAGGRGGFKSNHPLNIIHQRQTAHSTFDVTLALGNQRDRWSHYSGLLEQSEKR